jgi:hypothetical protein
MRHLYFKNLICALSILCLLFSGCGQNIKHGIKISLTPENRSKIKNIGIIVKDSPFRVKYTSNKEMTGSAALGGLIGVAIEGDACKKEDDKLAQQIYAKISPEYDVKEKLAQNIQSELKTYGFEKASIFSSKEQAIQQNMDTMLVCEILEWGVSIYPAAKTSDSVSTYIDLTVDISMLPEGKLVWEYSNIYFNRDLRTLSDFQKKDVLIKDLDKMFTPLSRKILNRLMNS